MKAVLMVVGLVVLYAVLRDGLFGSLTTGSPAYNNGRGVYAQTPWGNFGGSW